ncbi:hypothetical protein AZE42_05636 [Rhizopogon vesiculosus]|uniref:Uncharacterized protein n=1 Tax=Rhizopogon vesiculosus TaxID=180088 RepID=A0A1J8R2D7_9AGAM|nr:hypothetical protein AZE42_05636 [Rhizopogon vesiculosus]
MQSKLTWISLA